MEHWTLPYLMACWREAIRGDASHLAFFYLNCPNPGLRQLAHRIIGRHNTWIRVYMGPVQVQHTRVENYSLMLHRLVRHQLFGWHYIEQAKWNKQVRNDERRLLEYSKQLIEKGGC